MNLPCVILTGATLSEVGHWLCFLSYQCMTLSVVIGPLDGVFTGCFCLGEGCPPPPFGHLRQRRTGFLFLGVVLFADRVLFLLASSKCVPLEGPIRRVEGGLA
jgi:hypothetical protein